MHQKGMHYLSKTPKTNKYVVFFCDRSGNYQNRQKISINNTKKASSTQLIDCPFEIQGLISIACDYLILLES